MKILRSLCADAMASTTASAVTEPALTSSRLANWSADRQKIVLAVDLRAVAREIEQADAASFLQLGAEGADGLTILA